MGTSCGRLLGDEDSSPSLGAERLGEVGRHPGRALCWEISAHLRRFGTRSAPTSPYLSAPKAGAERGFFPAIEMCESIGQQGGREFADADDATLWLLAIADHV